MRKTENVTIPKWEGNRDAGKVFKITEMPAARAEKWALRALLMLKGSGERIPDNVQSLGMVGVAIVGLNVFLQGNINAADLDPLMDEMMTCVEIARDPKHPEVSSPIVSDADIEEVQTRLWLRSEVIRIHTNFSVADALSTLISTINSASTSATTSTSPPQ